MSNTESGSVNSSIKNSVQILTISNGEKNLLKPSVMVSLSEQLVASDENPAVSANVITGEGSFFCGGLDVGAIQAGGDPIEFATALRDLLAIFPKLKKPVVAAVNGPAVASGASLVAVVDYAVAVPTALIGTYEVSIGIWPMIAQVPLINRLGPRVAMENIGSGEPFSAQKSLEIGLVQKISPPDRIISDCLVWLDKANRAGKPQAIGRPSVYELAELSLEDALYEAHRKFVAMFESNK